MKCYCMPVYEWTMFTLLLMGLFETLCSTGSTWDYTHLSEAETEAPRGQEAYSRS